VEAGCGCFDATGTDIDILASCQAPLVLGGEDIDAFKNPDIQVPRMENPKRENGNQMLL
jgi:hypothetical protein